MCYQFLTSISLTRLDIDFMSENFVFYLNLNSHYKGLNFLFYVTLCQLSSSISNINGFRYHQTAKP